MPAFLDTVFGRKKPTSAAVAEELARRKAELAAIPGRITALETKLKRVADLTDAEHEDALAQLAALQRALVRLGAQVEDLEKAHDAAKAAENAAALRARADEAKKASEGMSKLLDELEKAYAPVVAIAEKISAKMAGVSAVNAEIAAAKKAGLEAPELVVPNYTSLWWEPDTTDPDREVWDDQWFLDGRQLGGMVSTFHDGKEYPSVGGAEKRKVRRVIPGKKRPGLCMVAPIFDLCLPATRLGGKSHWPRVS